MDLISFFLFFLVVIPFLLVHFHKQRKTCQEMLEQSKETNRLLIEIAGKIKAG